MKGRVVPTRPEVAPRGHGRPEEEAGLLDRALAFFDARPPVVSLAVAAAAIVGLGVLDAITGNQLRFFVFYWPPIALVAWVAGRSWSLGVVGMSGLAWLLAALWSRGPGETPGILAWNLIANMTSFAILAAGVAYVREVTERQRTLALTDHMTGVPNARAFLATLRGEVDRSRRSGSPLSLFYVDVDDFKTINDTLGHDVGNQLLQAVAASIRDQLRVGDTVARMGGDEFVALLPGSSLPEASEAVRRVLSAVTSEVRARGWTVTLSVGVVSATGQAHTFEEILRRADDLMYEVKRSGKNGLRTLDLSA